MLGKTDSGRRSRRTVRGAAQHVRRRRLGADHGSRSRRSTRRFSRQGNFPKIGEYVGGVASGDARCHTHYVRNPQQKRACFEAATTHSARRYPSVTSVGTAATVTRKDDARRPMGSLSMTTIRAVLVTFLAVLATIHGNAQGPSPLRLLVSSYGLMPPAYIAPPPSPATNYLLVGESPLFQLNVRVVN